MSAKALPVPKGFHTVTPYLVVPSATKLIEFAEKAFDAKTDYVHKFENGAVMHAQMRIGDSVVWLTDAKENWPAQSGSLYLYFDDCDAVYKKALEAGAENIMPPVDQFYGDRHGGVSFAGFHWWIATHIEDVSEEEIDRRQKEIAAKMAAHNK